MSVTFVGCSVVLLRSEVVCFLVAILYVVGGKVFVCCYIRDLRDGTEGKAEGQYFQEGYMGLASHSFQQL